MERLIEGLQDSGAPVLQGGAQEIAGPLASYRLTWMDASEDWRPATHRFVAASSIPRKERQVIENKSNDDVEQDKTISKGALFLS